MTAKPPPLRVAVIGQGLFGSETYKRLRDEGHNIVGVFTICDDKNGRADVLAQTAESDGVVVRKIKRWKALKKDGGHTLVEILDDYKSCNPDLNVLAFVTQFIPMEVIETPKHGSIVYHPSLLPRHRGASAINWTLMEGDEKAGFTIFFADDGLDTGPILLMRETTVELNDTVSTLYERFMFPEGVKAMGEAVAMIASEKYPKDVQPEEGATYDPIWKNKEKVAKIKWNEMTTSKRLHNFIRGNDRVPGAWTTIGDEMITLYNSMLFESTRSPSHVLGEIKFDGCNLPVTITSEGIVFKFADGSQVCAGKFQVGRRIIDGADFLQRHVSADEQPLLQLTADETAFQISLRETWGAILSIPSTSIEGDSDFFGFGAGSMDVVRLIEETKQKAKRANFENTVNITADEIATASTFDRFVDLVVRSLRGMTEEEIDVDTVSLEAGNGVSVSMPHQCFINGQFVDAASGKTYKSINPTTEEQLCDVSLGDEKDVDIAVLAADDAFKRDWRDMNARDRGALLYRLADLMEEHLEELATIESLDSGAVYTLALKTHIGMSIQTFRYFAGWCDKIEGKTIPINHSRPATNLCFTKREPYGVVGLVVPWNYPLMMLAWKSAAALAAGNCIVLKPAQVTPLASLKWAQLTQKAGFPPGVVNLIPGSGRTVGQRLADHPLVRKIGFTGSTGVGQTIMESAAKSNLKKVSLELGGKSPLIIFADCDMDKAVSQACSSAFFNKGENCIAAGRIFVHESIHDKFLASVLAQTKLMKIGDPLDVSTAHGPQNHEKHLNSLIEFVKRGVADGATLVHGGKRVNCKGYFLEPAIFTEVTDDMWIAKEESFGPIMILMKFASIDEVIARANACEFGLASGVLTKDISKALKVADRLEAGTVFVNCYNKTDVAAPFGGQKQSGFGKDLGAEALNEYLHTKTVTIEF